jgi:hypothetical protein
MISNTIVGCPALGVINCPLVTLQLETLKFNKFRWGFSSPGFFKKKLEQEGRRFSTL